MTQTKIGHLIQVIAEMKSVLVSFSGGIDSTLLLETALRALGPEKVLAVTASSETYPREELEEAKHLAETLGARHLLISTGELKNERFFENPPERCYYCKQELFGELSKIARSYNLEYVIDGANADDAGDFRPGLRAGAEHGVRSPLRETGITKAEIRRIAKARRLPNWDKPSMPCLSSRFPYGHTITSEKLHQVDEAERFLRSLGLDELRVRHHGDTARIEVPEVMIKKVASSTIRKKVTAKLKTLGFNYITLDLNGFRSGSMNEVLSKEILNG
ncbi:MAG: TIGR00268 family protein [Firmicutes bacterium HGW-Firmicutes-8]|nr:MAG: TIGR00268 family protein [Firmicutes bacterium HGW-Firmicutes-8]